MSLIVIITPPPPADPAAVTTYTGILRLGVSKFGTLVLTHPDGTKQLLDLGKDYSFAAIVPDTACPDPAAPPPSPPAA